MKSNDFQHHFYAIGFALVTYSNQVTISPTIQLSVGETTASWTIYVNEVN
jgi:hypothetical protein